MEVRWLDEREQRAWRAYLLVQRRLSAHLNRRLQVDSGLSLADFDVLVQLTDEEGARRVSELAEALQWERSRLSHQLGRMQRRDLVERQEVPGDGRGALVVLTATGRAAIEAAAPLHVETVRRAALDVLTADEVDLVGDLAQRVLHRLDGGAAAPAGG